MQGPYRAGPPGARIVHTRLARLPEATRQVLLSSKRDRDVAPHAISLRGHAQPLAFVVGAPLLALLYFFYVRSEVFQLLTTGDLFTIGVVSALGSFLVVFGLVSTLRGTPLRLRHQAILFPQGWVLCTTGIGSNIDAIPLSLVEALDLKGGKRKTLVVKLRSGEQRRYPMLGPEQMSFEFFAAGRDAIARQLPPVDVSSLGETRRSGPAPSWILSGLAAPICALGIVAALLVWNARAVATSERNYADAELRHAENESEPDRTRDVVDTLERYFEQTDADRASVGPASWLFANITTVDEDSARFRPILDAALARQAGAQTASEHETVTAGTDLMALRSILAAHPADELGAAARARIATLLADARERERLAGATPAQLAICDRIARDAAAGRNGVVLRVEAGPDDPIAFDRPEWASTTSARATAQSSISEHAFASFSASWVAALGDELEPTPGGVVATITVTLRPDAPVLEYTDEDTTEHRVLDSWSVPSLGADVRAVLTGDGEPFELTWTAGGAGDTMVTSDMASSGVSYNTPDALYRAQGTNIGWSIGAGLAHRLCLP